MHMGRAIGEPVALWRPRGSSALPPSPLAMAWQAAAESLVLTTCGQRRPACHAVAMAEAEERRYKGVSA